MRAALLFLRLIMIKYTDSHAFKLCASRSWRDTRSRESEDDRFSVVLGKFYGLVMSKFGPTPFNFQPKREQRCILYTIIQSRRHNTWMPRQNGSNEQICNNSARQMAKSHYSLMDTDGTVNYCSEIRRRIVLDLSSSSLISSYLLATSAVSDPGCQRAAKSSLTCKTERKAYSKHFARKSNYSNTEVPNARYNPTGYECVLYI